MILQTFTELSPLARYRLGLKSHGLLVNHSIVIITSGGMALDRLDGMTQMSPGAIVFWVARVAL